MRHSAYLGLGSNLGDRLNYLKAALAALQPRVNVLSTSPVYETEPWGFTEQDKFLNLVAQTETGLTPGELLIHIKAVEEQVGRRASFHYGPRQIDIDILLYDDLVLDEDGLQIPHPKLTERVFVLAPLADLAPDLIVPNANQTVGELLASHDTSGVKQIEVTHEAKH